MAGQEKVIQLRKVRQDIDSCQNRIISLDSELKRISGVLDQLIDALAIEEKSDKKVGEQYGTYVDKVGATMVEGVRDYHNVLHCIDLLDSTTESVLSSTESDLKELTEKVNRAYAVKGLKKDDKPNIPMTGKGNGNSN